MKNHGHHARPFLALPGERVTPEKSNQFSARYKALIVNSYNGSILQHVAQVLRSMQQTAQTDFSALVAVEDEVVVEARHQQIVSRAFAGTVAPDRPHLWKSRHQANRGLHRVHKTQRRAGISLAQGEGTRGANSVLLTTGVTPASQRAERSFSGPRRHPGPSKP
jgi:hypothetical protein